MTFQTGRVDFPFFDSLSGNVSLSYLEDLFARYRSDPSSVDAQWRSFFSQLEERASGEEVEEKPHWHRSDWPVRELDEFSVACGLEDLSAPRSRPRSASGSAEGEFLQQARDCFGVQSLLTAYRTYGHLVADLDPLRMCSPPSHPDLDPANHGFGPEDLDRPVPVVGIPGVETASVRDLVGFLRERYCSTVGVEYMHLSDPQLRAWFRDRIEGSLSGDSSEGSQERLWILDRLIEASGLEQFLDVKHQGMKRFGLDGGEAMIPALQGGIAHAASLGVEDVVLGMAHRGRLNVLTQILRKPFRSLFSEFSGVPPYPETLGISGDVKYHLGWSVDRVFDGKSVHISLVPNPSHLEAVDPVVLGKVRAKQDLREQGAAGARASVLPLLIHGDAAFAGQGVVAECLALSGLAGYGTAGSVHVIINNQVGFTASPCHTRSSAHPSDVGKMVDVPVLHVNGDDPAAVLRVVRLAVAFRQTFGKPVIVDMVCYRRFGHNESDEPAFTQPAMYRKIRARERITERYAKALIADGLLDTEEFSQRKEKFRSVLDREFLESKNYRAEKPDWLEGRWSGLRLPSASEVLLPGETGVAVERLQELGRSLCGLPEDFTVHRTVGRFLSRRSEAIESGERIDWATAEALAFASLLCEGHPVRLSGQDSARGTFSQRHSVLIDQEKESQYVPLNHLAEQQARYEVINSILSEESILSFEYGYSLTRPDTLVLWEAQFGDFSNGAQVLFDQFLSSGEQKWMRMSGLVCLLPHGYEGQGPEHSSARLERYLQMCAQENLQVANCTTPANYFHILRRQLKRDFRKPLILMTPKSLLRHKMAVSDLTDFDGSSRFCSVLPDGVQQDSGENSIQLVPDAQIRRVILCSGKVYYDLYEEREKRGVREVSLVRLEQFYPFPEDALLEALQPFVQAEVVWCQEEPRNMGAWSFVAGRVEDLLSRLGRNGERIRYVGRPEAAATATGSSLRHSEELRNFLEEAFAGF